MLSMGPHFLEANHTTTESTLKVTLIFATSSVGAISKVFGTPDTLKGP
jgi:hypothetical protein